MERLTATDDRRRTADASNLGERPAWRMHRYAIPLVFVLLVVMYLARLTSELDLSSDAPLYVLLGQHLARGEGYSLFGIPQGHAPPGLPLLLAGIMQIAPSSTLALNLGMILIGLAALFVSYRALLHFTDRGRALAVTLVVGFSWAMFHNSGRAMTDVPFMLLIYAALWCILKGLKSGRLWLEAGVLLLVASCWFRLLGFPFAAAAVPALFLNSRQVGYRRVALSAVVLTAGLALTLSIFTTRYYQARNDYETATYERHIERLAARKPKEKFLTPVQNALHTGSPLLGLFAGQTAHLRVANTLPRPWMTDVLAQALFGVPIIFGMVALARRRQWIVVFAVSAYLGLLVYERVPLIRYLLPLMPILLLAYFAGLESMLARVSKLRAHVPKLITGCAVLLILINVPNNLYRTYHIHSGQRFTHEAALDSLREVAAYLRRNASPGDMFIGDLHHQLGLLSGVPFLQRYDQRVRRVSGWKENLGPILRQHGVTHVVCIKQHYWKWFWQDLQPAARRDPDLVPVFQNDQFTVYAFRSDTRPRNSSATLASRKQKRDASN